MALVSERGFSGRSGIDKTLVSLWKSGKRAPTIDKMEEVLMGAGASVVQDKVWEVKINKITNSMDTQVFISVDDRLPKQGQKVYIRIIKDDKHVKDTFATYNNGQFYYFEDEKMYTSDYVKFWAEPLPIQIDPSTAKMIDDLILSHLKNKP